MWAWLAFPVLARVLMASQEADQIGPKGALGSDIVMEEEVGDGELLQEKMKPVSESEESGWREDLPGSTLQGIINPYEKSISNLISDLSLSGPKMFSKKPEEREEERNKRSSLKDIRNTEPIESWISWINLENKALRSQSRQDPWKEIKKSRAFSPWGGKRVTVLGQGAKVRRPIRVPFNSWGGKRAHFSSWGGKRDWITGPEENYEKNGAQKRTKFSAWGGKRSKNGVSDDEEVKRTRFNAWGGKRSFNNEKRLPEEIETKRSTFNAWGGKRSFTSIGEAREDKWERAKEEDTSHLLNKPSGSIDADDTEDVGYGDETRLSENRIIQFPKKKISGIDYGRQNMLFNPWGGKKKRSQSYDELQTRFDSILPSSNELQGRFWPWGG